MTNSSTLLKNKKNLQDSICWIITEGMVGTENQCIAVAEALCMPYKVIKIGLKQPWKTLSPWLMFENKWIFTLPLNPPWPDLIIASGRKSIAASRYIKKQSGGKTFTVQIQDPKVGPSQFDLVAVPFHDTLRDKNVIVTDGAPNKITPLKLKEAHEEFSILFQNIKSPRIAVLIGGNSRTHQLTKTITKNLCDQLNKIDAGLMVTTSRRTGEDNLKIIQSSLNNPDTYIWDGTGKNPYLGMLAWADFIVVTSDSVSMLSDAGTTGKPVYMIPLKGRSPRFQRLYDHFTKLGVLRLFTGNLEEWDYTPLRDAQKIASIIKENWDKPQN